jgi:hypothetical protein
MGIIYWINIYQYITKIPRTKGKAKDKDKSFKAKAKGLTRKAKAKDFCFVLKNRPRPRTNISALYLTAVGASFSHCADVGAGAKDPTVFSDNPDNG